MTQVLKAYQIPAYKGENEIRWSVENIDIVYDRKTEKWSYYLLEYDEEKQDWTDRKVSKKEASKLCLVPLPKRFYE